MSDGFEITVKPSEYQSGRWEARLVLRGQDPLASTTLTDGYETPLLAIEKLLAFLKEHEPEALAA